MATHGMVYLPLSDGKMLSCEAWSDGYLTGVGLGAWCSSAKIGEVSRAAAALAGTPFFWDAAKGKLECKNMDYLGDFADNVQVEQEELRPGEMDAIEDAEAFGEMLEERRWEDAMAHGLGKMTLARQMELGLGMNAEILEESEVRSILVGDGRFLSPEEAAEVYAEALAKSARGDEYEVEQASHDYAWLDGRFWTSANIPEGPDGDGCELVAVPLGMTIAAESNGTGCHGDAAAYMSDCSENDWSDMKLLVAALEKRGLGPEALFEGNKACWSRLFAEKECEEIHAACAEGSRKGPSSM